MVGTHAHTPRGAGQSRSAYVSYGLSNFYWYHGNESETGVLDLAVQDGEAVAAEWVPGGIPQAGGAPRALTGDQHFSLGTAGF